MMCSFLQTLLSCVMIVYNDNDPDFVKIFLQKRCRKTPGEHRTAKEELYGFNQPIYRKL